MFNRLSSAAMPPARPVLPLRNTFRTLAGTVAIFLFAAVVCPAASAAENTDLEKGKSAYARKSFEEAAEHFRLAAEQGDAEAQLEFGKCLFKGEGVEKDQAAAAKWILKAAEQGNIEAQYEIASFFGKGVGFDKDEEEAFKWVRMSADNGFAKAQLFLGKCYLKGEHFDKDEAEAEQWFRKAAGGFRAQA